MDDIIKMLETELSLRKTVDVTVIINNISQKLKRPLSFDETNLLLKKISPQQKRNTMFILNKGGIL